ncbi:MAG TPA: helix-turn-helix transcriptional regulator [Ktedonobacteraceae bacterium]|nr:helix-turn-helix transcriptional regulator [Ktedonobacteraceae bacterium]
MKMVRSYLRVLLAEKEVREKRSISLRRVARETEVSISTIMGLANNTLREVPLGALAVLCDYLHCRVGDLLRLEDAQEDGSET